MIVKVSGGDLAVQPHAIALEHDARVRLELLTRMH